MRNIKIQTDELLKEWYFICDVLCKDKKETNYAEIKKYFKCSQRVAGDKVKGWQKLKFANVVPNLSKDGRESIITFNHDKLIRSIKKQEPTHRKSLHTAGIDIEYIEQQADKHKRQDTIH